LLKGLQPWKREASVVVNLLDSGPDLLLRTDAPLPLADRTALSVSPVPMGCPRIAWARGGDAPEPVCVLRAPVTMLPDHGCPAARRVPAGDPGK